MKKRFFFNSSGSCEPRRVMALVRLFCALGGEVLRLTVPCTTALFESRLAARHVAALVREKHLESCFSLRLPLQELFDVLVFLNFSG